MTASAIERVFVGGCLCGAVRYRATGPVRQVNYCHCAMCRRHSGAPVAAFATFARASFVYTRGAPQAFRSSPAAERGFCAECGTPLTWESRDDRAWIDVGVGTLDDAQGLLPRDHLWTESAIPWFKIDDALPRHRRGRSEG